MAGIEIPEVESEEFTDDERAVVEELRQRVREQGETLQEALGLSEAFVESMEESAHRLYRAGRYDDAGVLIDAILALDDRRHYPYLLAGDVAMEKERWEEAVQCLGAALELGPPTAMVEGKLGEALIRVGRPEDAACHLAEAVELGGEDSPYRRRAEVLLGLIGEAAAEKGTARATG